MADFNAALIAFAGVLVGGYANNFLAEDYRRFRDGQALAGALAGELRSHAEPFPILQKGLEKMTLTLADGKSLSLSEWPMASSPMFEENASRIGLLGPGLAQDTAYVYENIRAFRIAFHQLSKHHKDMPPEWSESMVGGCQGALGRAEHRGQFLLQNLDAFVKDSYWQRPATQAQLKYGAIGLVVFFLLLLMLK